MTNCRHLSSFLSCFAALSMLPIAAAQTGTFIDRWVESDVRVVTYNVLWDSIFEDPESSELPDRFTRVINSLQPDVLALQEIRQGAAATAALMNSLVPLDNGNGWYAHGHSDNVILSRYPFLLTTDDGGHADVLIDLPDATYDDDLFVLSDHLPCCSNESGRQLEADQIVKWLEDGRTPGGSIDLPNETPMVVLGDFNIVRSGQPLETLITGDIINNNSFGADSPPDWDGTALTDARPLHNGIGTDTYTWRDDSSQFDPGVLDYILYTDSVVEVGNSFVLNPTTLSSGMLAATGLELNDVVIDENDGTFDHLPVIVDFRLASEPLAGDYNGDGFVDAADRAVWSDQYGSTTDTAADGNGDGQIDAADYTIWRDALAPTTSTGVPEPAGFWLIGLGLFLSSGSYRPASRQSRG